MNKKSAQLITPDLLHTIKKTTIIAIFSDDDLLDMFVLKGGNAMDIVHKVSSRASVDLDFSVPNDLDVEVVQPKVEAAIKAGFDGIGYLAFDINMTLKPRKMPSDLASFWGGYAVEFKLIALERATELALDLDDMRRQAINLGQGSKFTIDISCHECVEGKQVHELDGYTVYVYSPAMIVCEKLRAICQQMPEYADIIQRQGLGNQRARDFIDIETLIHAFSIDLGQSDIKDLVKSMFDIKRVPIELLGKISTTKELHSTGYDSVRDTMWSKTDILPFDYYFDFVVEQAKKLETLWNI